MLQANYNILLGIINNYISNDKRLQLSQLLLIYHY